MTTLTVSLPRPHTTQRTVLKDARRFNVLACGRRWGKSTLGLHLLARPALAGRPVGYFAPTYKLLLEVWRALRSRLAPVTAASNATERRLELVTGGVVEFWTLEDENAGRSRKYARAVVDEAGLVPNLGEIWHAAIRPTLADLAGDAWLMGTPKGRNYFWTAYQRGHDDPEWRSWQRSTGDNPYIPPAEVDAMRRELPERIAAQEIDAAFLEDGGGVFRGVRRAATAQRREGPEQGRRYVMAVDWGKVTDYTVVGVGDLLTKSLVHMDRFQGLDYTVQIDRIVTLYKRFGAQLLIPERNSMGEPLIEQLARRGVAMQPFVTTNATKANAVDALALAFEQGALQILDDPTLVAELEAFESSRTSTGLTRYAAPEGLHDDCVMMLAMLWQGMQSSAGGGLFR